MDNKRDRESRKQKLRARLIDNETVWQEEEEEELYKKKKKRRKVRLAVAAAIAAMAAAGIIGYKVYQNNHQYTQASVIWEKELAASVSSGYEAYGENVLRYTRDGAAYVGKTGEEVWNQAFEMKDPFAVVNGDYAAIADRDGYSIYICDKNGCQGTVTTTLPVSKLSISATGITVAVLEDTKSNTIAFYDKQGTKLKIEVQTTLAGNGYPIDLSISPNGMILMVSYVYLDEGMMQNQVVFYNFDDEGQSIKDRLVGGFKEYGNSMVARVRFLDDTHACAFAQDRLCFYSLENTVKPEMVKQIDINGEISSIFYSHQYAGVLVKDGSNKKLFLYGNTGKEVFSRDIDREYEHVEISGSHVLLYREEECEIYNASGNLKFRGGLYGSTDKLIYMGDNLYIQTGPQAMRGLELQ